MINTLRYYWKIKERFGLGAAVFLFRSKFKKDKINNISIPTLKYPISLSNYQADVSTLFKIFFAEEYNITLKESPSFIIDCGANIGLSAVYFANKYPLAKIVAIEPDKGNFQYLLRNTKPYQNVVCLNKAIWNKEAQMDIVDPGSGNWGLQTVVTHTASEHSIAAVTLEQVMKENNFSHIDLLKIDIEGAEEDLFRDNYDYWLHKTRVIAIELHDTKEHQSSHTFYSAIKNIPNKQYEIGENLICELMP